MITRVPGTQDILDLTSYNQLTSIIRDHFTRAAFEEIATPLIEHTELFKRSLGTGTDIMSKELYFVNSIHTAEAERTQLCLRPEATAPILRAYLNNHIQKRPWHAFTIGPMFRHERQQKGRYRQFTQASIECIGTTTVAQDAHLIMLLDRLFAQKLQMRQYALLINFMGCPEDRKGFLALLQPFLETHKERICATCIQRAVTNPLRIFDCKNESCQALYTQAPQISGALCSPCGEEWAQLQQLLLQLSVSFSHAPRLVRGLDYYEKTVFEFVSVAHTAETTIDTASQHSSQQTLACQAAAPAGAGGVGWEFAEPTTFVETSAPKDGPAVPAVALTEHRRDKRSLACRAEFAEPEGPDKRSLGAQSTFCGGGRYNHLALAMGASKDIPAIGAGLGIERILMLSEPYLQSIAQKEPLHIIVPTTPAQQSVALHLFDALQAQGEKQGYVVEVLLAGDSLKSMLRAADKRGATTCLLIGPDEQQAGTVTVKWMQKGIEEKIPQRDVVTYVRKS